MPDMIEIVFYGIIALLITSVVMTVLIEKPRELCEDDGGIFVRGQPSFCVFDGAGMLIDRECHWFLECTADYYPVKTIGEVE